MKKGRYKYLHLELSRLNFKKQRSKSNILHEVHYIDNKDNNRVKDH